MSGGQPGHGAFPVSYMLEWHGGMHLAAPMGGNGVALPVRAIADGTVVFIRQRTDADSPDEPLNYGDGYTSDAVVVIRHDTETGASAAGQATQVRFYSVYMHLHSIQPTVRPGRPIHRKDDIGQAGHIYGEPNVMHFEICCDDGNLARLVGRATGNLNLAADGRTDVLFGEMYFHLPAGTPIFGAKPLPQFTQAMTRPAAPRGQPARPPQALPAVHTTANDYVVGVHYAGGEGAAGQRGDALVTTYRMNGETEGTPVREADAEYGLYTTAVNISEAYPAASRPAISAVYELLRFGRVVGPDTLTPADVPHWREVSYPGGQGWVNLNAANVHKFSDADFPQWKGWALIDDDTNGDSRCDSAMLRRMIYGDGAASLQPSRQQATAQLNSPAVQGRLARTVCKFPSEWDASTIDQRWSWLKTQSDENPEALTEDDYAALKAHVQALCFPLPELFSAQWCFNPREFIKQFSQCGWLSADELESVLAAAPAAGRARAATLRVSMNKMLSKYTVNASRLRLSHFFAQVGHETGWWQYREELGNERYFRTMYEIITPQEAAEDFRSGLARRLGLVRARETEQAYAARRPTVVLAKAATLDNGAANSAVGGQAGDGSRFRGRGFLQITGRRNYTSYGTYRGRDLTTDPNPRLLASDNFNACDASGFYWTRERANVEADDGSVVRNITRVGGIINRGRATAVPLHDQERQTAFTAIWSKLNDSI